MEKRHIIIPIFIPHKGCPFDCIFCNQKTISGQMDEMTVEKMHSIIEQHLRTARENTYMEIGFYGGSFTGIEEGQQIKFLREANKYVSGGKVKGIRLSTRPDYITRDILEYLKFYNVKIIELGVQSLDEEVLIKSCRGHTIYDVITASNLIKEYGIGLGIQTMIGLPGDSREKDLITADKVIELAPDIVRIYPALVIRGTYMEYLFRKGDYQPFDIEKSVEICAELLDLYENYNIKVIRVGLQATDNINNDMEVVAGPFHPAFRQLVESRRALNYVEKYIRNNNLSGTEQIIIYTGDRNISNVVGQKRANINYLKKKYNIKRIVVNADIGLNNEINVNPFVKI